MLTVLRLFFILWHAPPWTPGSILPDFPIASWSKILRVKKKKPQSYYKQFKQTKLASSNFLYKDVLEVQVFKQNNITWIILSNNFSSDLKQHLCEDGLPPQFSILFFTFLFTTIAHSPDSMPNNKHIYSSITMFHLLRGRPKTNITSQSHGAVQINVRNFWLLIILTSLMVPKYRAACFIHFLSR